jgi:hypothetical protein
VRLYGKKFARGSLRSSSFARDDTKNAVLWDIPDDRYCRVKVQGSAELVLAWFPDIWAKRRGWLVPGTPVRIGHVGGAGRIELLGQGLFIPTPISGEMFPTIAAGDDGILAGCALRAADIPRMAVIVEPGTYRISGITYSLVGGEFIMSATSNLTMGDGFLMGLAVTVVSINAPPAVGQYRYDLISVGADGVVDYTAGTAVASDPVKPSLAGGHVMLGDYILVYGGMTEITQSDIGATWTTPTPASLGVTIADSDLSWVQLSTTVTLKCLDQYGNPVSGTGTGWYFALEFKYGNGTLYSLEEGNSTTKIGGHGLTQYAFTYTRDGLDPGDLSPLFLATVSTVPELVATARIILRDSGGGEM